MKFIVTKNNNQKSKVVLIGAGPGDPDLITLKGVQYLQKADVVIRDFLANDKLLNHCNPEAEIIYVGKRAGHHSLKQKEINQLLIEKAKSHKLIVRLKGGDPFVFGRGGEEVLALHQAGINFEVIPGVTAGTAALCYAGIPSTHRGDATSVSFITGHEDPTKKESDLNWEAIASIKGTLVFYMGLRNLPNIVDNLLKNGKSPETPVALIRWGTLPNQQTLIGNLQNIVNKTEEANFQPPALIVVGDVVKYQNQMNWFEKRPLFGKTIVVTRARAQASNLEQQLQDLGANVLQFPTIRIKDPESWQPLDQAINNLNNYDWIVFTSVNGVEKFFNRLATNGFDARKFQHVKVASIGPATTEKLKTYGIIADLVPPKYVAESLLEGIKAQGGIEGQKFLLPRTEEARAILREELIKAGAEVDEIVTYRTVLETDQKETIVKNIKSGKIDLITFTSSSTVKNFVKLTGEKSLKQLKSVTIACIGPITKQKAESYGLECKIMPEDYTIPGLINEIEDYY
jgi:uroporphyrinogen III methyltransferase / synthase